MHYKRRRSYNHWLLGVWFSPLAATFSTSVKKELHCQTFNVFNTVLHFYDTLSLISNMLAWKLNNCVITYEVFHSNFSSITEILIIRYQWDNCIWLLGLILMFYKTTVCFRADVLVVFLLTFWYSTNE